MRKHHPKNERIKRRYLAFLEEAKRMSATSVDQVAAALSLFEESTGYKDFGSFHVEQARRFKRLLREQVNSATGRNLAAATIYSRLMALRAFFFWLAGQQGYRSRLTYSDSDYFNPSSHETEIAKAPRERPVPTVQQIRHVLDGMPDSSELEKRNRALLAFTLLSGARDNAISSMSLRHVDPVHRRVFQDARDVRTKNRKTITSTFFPVGDATERIFLDWLDYLKREKLFGDNDPLFPAAHVSADDNGLFRADGLSRMHWKDAAPIRRIFRQAFEDAGLLYCNPHSFRKTLAGLGQQICSTPEALKAWSQNLGHDHVLTTFTSYGLVGADRQAEILGGLAARETNLGPATDRAQLDRIERMLTQLGGASRQPA